jgi:hypothetical protein
MDYIVPTLLIGMGVLGVREHLAIKHKQHKQDEMITKLVKQQEIKREADIKMVEELKKWSLFH